MKVEGRLFAGIALYFGVTGLVYWIFSSEPAGTTALAVGFLMSSLVAFFFYVQYRKRGLRPQDRREAEIADTAGPLDFFPPRSIWPATAALGLTVLALGVVFGLWLALIGFGLLAGAVFGFVFQYTARGA
ncbi:cytochrome c oxidase subunit 4 [Kitasatospora sp. MAP5-34]|uniref:aa3-type cytochrome oxidase subunit IV n=1 Tax=Kitasatospora sp. MAP5-34 TaxID=3035102 RepID=UPI00247403F3|nr:cytochrome c oxidase subunit 4 [Kitasatospora sp. MAP5-34]MDH6575784.1 tetrahydromethanopterin S-methyltransferase subunit B [Kitasatospora sp. MAP5-34]